MGLTVDSACIEALRNLPPGPKKALRAAIDQLRTRGLEAALDIRRLETEEPGPAAYRVRVGTYRLGLLAAGNDLRLAHVFHRSEGYGWLERLG